MFRKLFCFIFFVFLSGMCYVATGNVPIIKPTAIYVNNEPFGLLPLENETAFLATEKHKNKEYTI